MLGTTVEVPIFAPRFRLVRHARNEAAFKAVGPVTLPHTLGSRVVSFLKVGRL